MRNELKLCEQRFQGLRYLGANGEMLSQAMSRFLHGRITDSSYALQRREGSQTKSQL